MILSWCGLFITLFLGCSVDMYKAHRDCINSLHKTAATVQHVPCHVSLFAQSCLTGEVPINMCSISADSFYTFQPWIPCHT
ncbi:hypothetical protein CDV36_003733 [Fusarium kuroshium]|uniref:Extracellular membrane protein CFEM domain-containing protein n=1 Tax=Fusarium kuroshium TaxID=2010991 RepID=A0A3M2SHJ2_9HYPO|nr:hypothetical protein CDV36_003733 [Fusarium kuroshium]